MTANIPTPILTNLRGPPLPGNRISVAEERVGVEIRVPTSNLAKGTRVTAIFDVVTPWSEEKTIEKQGDDLKFRVDFALYAGHVGKQATITCKYNQVDSPSLTAPIVD